jgi:hypothetical protein
MPRTPRTAEEAKRIADEYYAKRKRANKVAFNPKVEILLLRYLKLNKKYHYEDLGRFLAEEGYSPGTAGPISSYMVKMGSLERLGGGYYQLAGRPE